MDSRLHIFVAALFACAGSIRVNADKFILNPVADTSLVEVSPTNNFGKTSRLRVGGDTVGRNRSIIKFDLSSLPSTSKVVAASLKLHIPPGDIGGTRGPTWMFRTLRDWNEGTKEGTPATGNEATWQFPKNPDEPWREPGGKWIEDFAFDRSGDSEITGTSLPAFTRFDGPVLSMDLQGWLDQPESNFGWFLYASTDDCYTSLGGTCYSIIHYGSREDGAFAPELTLFTGNPDAPRAFLNNEFIDQNPVHVDTLGAREIRLESPYPRGHVFFTVDGSKPTLISPRYERSFQVNPGDILRVVTYSSDYSEGGVELALNFVALPTFSFNISRVGSGGAYFSPSPNTSPTRFSSNTVMRLVAVPMAGWIFAGWTGDLQSPESEVTFTLTRDTSIQANFIPSGFVLTTRRIQNDFVLVQFNALPENTYHLLSSPDLQAWATAQTFNGKTGVVDAIFELEPSGRSRFFRVLSGPKGTAPPY